MEILKSNKGIMKIIYEVFFMLTVSWNLRISHMVKEINNQMIWKLISYN